MARARTKDDDVCWHFCPACKKDWNHVVHKSKANMRCALVKFCRKCRGRVKSFALRKIQNTH